MQFKHQLISIFALALAASHAQAAIAVGENSSQNIAWIEGDNQCSQSEVISAKGVNPCDRHFTLRNGHTYRLEGCGGPLWLMNEDNTFNSNCPPNQASLGCGITKKWLCG